MKAIVFEAPGVVRVAERPLPAIEHPGDALVRVTAAGICGSDLHIVDGRDRGCRPGTILGHELVGVVDEVGPAVTRFRPGDRVVSPFSVSCGACFYCRRALPARCVSAACFGFVSDEGRGLEGAQAEVVRVPLADSTLVRVPDRGDDGAPLLDREALFLGDILSTAWGCAEAGGIQPGDVVAVVGCGPVGLLCVEVVRQLQPAAVVAVEAVPYRREQAARFGAEAVAPAEAAAAVRARSEGRGADVVLEAVGAAPALDLAIEMVRPGGTVSIAGYHTDEVYPLRIQAAYGKNLTLKIGRCNARHHMDRLLPLVAARALRHTEIISHELPLSEGAEAYAIFRERREGAIKVLLDPRR
jgi:2-desacetyl-2-hydroxyethyl bacteriochlorophyllide A dehydrogenase